MRKRLSTLVVLLSFVFITSVCLAQSLPPSVLFYLLDNPADCSEADIIGEWEFKNLSNDDTLFVLQPDASQPYLNFLQNHTTHAPLRCENDYYLETIWELVDNDSFSYEFDSFECVLGREGIRVRLQTVMDEGCRTMSGTVTYGSFVPIALDPLYIVSAKKVE